MIRIGVVQFEPVFGKTEKNLEKVEALLTGRTLDLVVLPELFCSGYLFTSRDEVEALALSIPDSPIIERMKEWSNELNGTIVAGIPERGADGFYNSAVIIDAREKLIDVYRKVHLFAEEKRWFRPGNLGFRVWSIQGVTIGVMVCFDWIFPEACRTLMLKGAQVIAHPANLVLPYCQRALPIRSLENRVFIACANRVGDDIRSPERRLHFTGRSMIVGPDASILGELDDTSESILEVEIDPTEARNFWMTSFNHLLIDRRPEAYHLL